MHGLFAALLRALDWCRETGQRSNWTNSLFPLGSLSKRRYSRPHEWRVGRTIPRSARTVVHFTRIFMEMRPPCFPRLYAAASLKR